GGTGTRSFWLRWAVIRRCSWAATSARAIRIPCPVDRRTSTACSRRTRPPALSTARGIPTSSPTSTTTRAGGWNGWRTATSGSAGVRRLAEHWKGGRCRIAKAPNGRDQETQNELTGVAAVAPDDVWAVGSATDFHPGGTPLIVHWNGTRWTRVPNDCGMGLTE